MPSTDSPNAGSLSGARSNRSTGNAAGPGGALASPMRSHEFEAHDVNPQLTGAATANAAREIGENGPGDRSGFGAGGRASEMTGQLRQTTRQAAQESYEQARQFTNEALEKARHQLRESRGQITQRAREMLDQQKQQLCQGLDHVVQAAHAAARSLEERDSAGVARYAHMAGDSLERVHEYLCAAGVDDVAQDARQFVRRHPEWVIGGLFIAGLALARMIKADRPIGPRGRLPHGADDGLWRDVYHSQFDASEEFGAPGAVWGDFDDSDAAFGEDGRRQRGAPGVAGYNPSGDYGDASAGGAGYGESYGTAATRGSEASASFPGGSAGIGEVAPDDDGAGRGDGRSDRTSTTGNEGQQKGDWQ